LLAQKPEFPSTARQPGLDGYFYGTTIGFGCGEARVCPLTVANIGTCNASLAGGKLQNTLFQTKCRVPIWSHRPYEAAFGTLGRNGFPWAEICHSGPWGVHKTVKLTETANLRFSAEAQKPC